MIRPWCSGSVVLLCVLCLGQQAVADSFPGSFAVPDSDVRIKFGGYVKLDAIHDFDGMGSTDNFSVGTIPTDGSGVENTRLHARQSRFNVDVRGPSKKGAVRAFIEGDFYGTSNAFRVRHAYGTVGGLLGGQTWTTFMDEDALPPTLDYNEPEALVFERIAMLRWTQHFNEKHLAAIAVEEPTGTVSSSAGAGATETPWPFVTGRARSNGDWGHAQVSAFAGGLRFRPAAGSADDLVLFGLNGSTRINTTGNDKLILQAVWGHGVAAYRNGVVAAPDANGKLETILTFGATVSYLHHWNDRLSSHGVLNYGEESNTDGQAASELKSVVYSALNVVWHLTSRATVGVEYLYGEREDKGGAKGHNNRVMLSTQVSI